MIKKLFPAIFWLLFLGLVTRLLPIYSQYSGDVRNHLAWADSFMSQSQDFYSRRLPGFNLPNYPSLTVLTFVLFRSLYILFNQLALFLNQSLKLFPSSIVFLFPTLNMQAAFLKVPAILADLGVACLLFKLFPSRNKKAGLLVAALYLFNPAVIYISAVWGQIESLPLFFLLLSLFYIKNKKYLLSHLCFAAAILFKQTALWLAPVYLFFWFRKYSFRQLVLGLVVQSAAFVAAYLPFGLNPLQAFQTYFASLSGSSTFVSDAAWNLWYFLFASSTTSDSSLFWLLPARYYSIGLLVLSTLAVLIYLYKKTDQNRLYASLFFLSLAAFFFQTRVHERHLAPALVFLLLTPIKNRPLYFSLYILLSVFHMFNLYSSLRLPFV